MLTRSNMYVLIMQIFIFIQVESNVQRNSGQYYYNIPPPGRYNEGNLVNSHHNLNHLATPTHSHSLSHSHAHSHSSPPVTTAHSHSNSAGQISLGLTHNRNSTNHNGYMHGNNPHGPAGSVYPSANPGHNREPSALDLAGSREQRGSAFELYRKPVHHYNMR